MQQPISNSVPRQLGKYRLLEKIATGGMAELFKAKVTGEGGFEKLLAIKRILPHLSADQDLISMFIDEARLAALLSHQNIVQIYDFGKEGDTYFIAMEYLQGWDLKTVLQKAEQGLPLEFALHITSRICAGLEHSHNLRDLNGNPLKLIHRDISPQNIFITCSGEIKILDFGIAKVASRSPSTRIGGLKGKASYMSPEQAVGEEIDRRSDIFSTGVLLYEMVAGSKMFRGDTKEVLEQVRRVDFAPLELVVRGLPVDVYTVVHKALAKEPEDRYQSCGEMLAALEGCLTNSSARPTAERLSKYVHDLCDAETRDVETNGAIEAQSVTEEESNQPTMSGAGLDSTDKTETVFDLEEEAEFGISRLERNGVSGRRVGIGLVSFAAVAALVVAMILASGNPAKKQGAGISEHAAAKVEREEHEKAEPLPVEKLVTRPESPAKTADVHALDLLDEGIRLAATQPDKALEILGKSVELDPTNARTYFELAKIQTKFNDYPKAIESYERAGVLNPNFPDIFFNLGFLYAAAKEYPRSEEMYKRAAALSPPYLDEIYFNLAMVQKAQGKSKESGESLRQALAINPHNEKALRYVQKSGRPYQGEQQ